MNLASTSDLLQVVTSSTAAIKVQASYVDLTSTVATPVRQNTNISSAATTSVVSSPVSGVVRDVKFVSIYNADASVANTVTLQHTDGSTVSKIVSYSLKAGETLIYQLGQVAVLSSAAQHGRAPLPGRLLRLLFFFNTSNVQLSNTITTTQFTNTMKVRVQAGGGGGGGCPAVTSAQASSGGGGAGAYAEKVFTSVTPASQFSFVVGVGGGGGTGAADGTAGGNSTFTLGATTITCNGGNGGKQGASQTTGNVVLGGAATAVPTNGDINVPGAPGEYGFGISATQGYGGRGGNSMFGGGGRGTGGGLSSGFAGTVYGSGGGGAITTSTVQTGGTGTRGIIIVEEYS